MKYPTITLLVIAFASYVHGQTPNIPNPGFEDGINGWSVQSKDKSIIQTLSESAHSGSSGLRLADKDDKKSGKVMCEKFSVSPSQPTSLNFWAKIVESKGAEVFLVFYDAEGKELGGEGSGKGTPKFPDNVKVNSRKSDWQMYSIKGKSPEKAISAAIILYTWSPAMVTIDFDDFSFEQGSESTPASSGTPAEAGEGTK